MSLLEHGGFNQEAKPEKIKQPYNNTEVVLVYITEDKTMSLVINTNTSASVAASNLQESNSLLQRSLNRLSSGSKITRPSDDAGGLAVSMKIKSAIKRNGAVQNNIGNAISFLQSQDGALKTVGKILDRMSELKILRDDPTKSTSDKSNYQTEFNALQKQLGNLKAESFNGVSLFSSTSGNTLSLGITEDGTKTISITKSPISASTGGLSIGGTDLTNVSNSLGTSGISVANIRTAIENIATMRASNGAEASQLEFAAEMLSVNKTNLQAANSRITDTDIAEESTQFARYNILTQSGVAMLAQANSTPQIALQLLG